MKRVLVTGASGFIGRQAIPFLRERGYEIHAVTVQAPTKEDGFRWHQTDLLKGGERRALMEAVQPTHVLHFAWIATPGIYWTSPLNADWHEATLDLLSLSHEAGVKRFVGAGTCAEYDWSAGHCDELATPLLPATPYGKAKAACGRAVIEDRGNISTAWGRIFLLYGPHESETRLVPAVIRALLRGEHAQCTHGNQLRDFLHVSDVASAFAALLDCDVSGPVNIASGTPVTIRAIVESIAGKLEKSSSVDFGAIPPPANDPPRLTAAIGRLRDEVGWQPHYSLDTGLTDTIQWWQSRLP